MKQKMGPIKKMSFIRVVKDSFMFQLRKSCRQINDRKRHSINAIGVICCLGLQSAYCLDRAYVGGGFGDYYVIDTTIPSISFQTPIGSDLYVVAITPNGMKTYAVDTVDNTTYIFNAITDAFITSIPAPATTTPLFVATSPDGTKAYVVNYQNNPTPPSSVTVIDVATDSVIGSPIDVGFQSQMIAITPDSSKMYVPNYGSGDDTVSVIIGNSSSPISVGARPIHLAITPAGDKVYVANYFGHSVSVIDVATDTVLATISLPSGSSPQFIGINPSGTEAYVANYDGNSISVIQTATDSILTTIPLPIGSSPWYIVFTPDGSQAYVANYAGDSVSIIDTSNHSVITTVPVGNGPNNLAALPNGKFVYVANQSSNFISIINTETFAVLPLNGIIHPNWIAVAPASLFPPRSLKGKQEHNRFLTQTDLVNVISWAAPEDSKNIMGYNIYRNASLTDLAGFVNAFSKLIFEDHNRKKGKAYTYYITSVYGDGSESSPQSITVNP